MHRENKNTIAVADHVGVISGTGPLWTGMISFVMEQITNVWFSDSVQYTMFVRAETYTIVISREV